jgi:hypothetical protein
LEVGVTPEQTIAALDDATLLRVLSEVTTTMRETVASGQTSAVSTAEEARASLEGLLDAGEIAHGPIAATQLADPVIARGLLLEMLRDPELAPMVADAVANPPLDRQKGFEAAYAGAVILGGLIAWLQTKIEIRVAREGGKTEFLIHMKKGATSDEIIKQTAKEVAGLLGVSGA